MQFGATNMMLVLPLMAGILAQGAEYRISGPTTQENLSIFLIHGANKSVKKFLTLSEGLEQHKVIVYETGRVNELAIENTSPDEDVYIQSGEIVKGGQQDRTFKDDLILGAKSGKVPIAAFCVEHGRWSRRGDEAVHVFSSAPQAVATKQMKMAVRAADQSRVWSEVAKAQDQLSMTAGSGVRAPASPSSFMLSLESRPVEQQIDGFLHVFLPLIDGQTDVIGYAFAVNGKVNSAEVYATHDLFQKLWPKLIRASAVEALANYQREMKFTLPTFEAVRAAIVDADHGQGTERDVNARTVLVKKETAQNVVFETRDKTQPASAWVHRSYMTK